MQPWHRRLANRIAGRRTRTFADIQRPCHARGCGSGDLQRVLQPPQLVVGTICQVLLPSALPRLLLVHARACVLRLPRGRGCAKVPALIAAQQHGRARLPRTRRRRHKLARHQRAPWHKPAPRADHPLFRLRAPGAQLRGRCQQERGERAGWPAGAHAVGGWGRHRHQLLLRDCLHDRVRHP